MEGESGEQVEDELEGVTCPNLNKFTCGTVATSSYSQKFEVSHLCQFPHNLANRKRFTHTYTHSILTAIFPGGPGLASCPLILLLH